MRPDVRAKVPAGAVGPMNPVIVPGGTSKPRSSTAVTLPNRLVKP